MFSLITLIICIYIIYCKRINALYASSAYISSPETVSELDTLRYSGMWYQISSDAFVYNNLEYDAYCATVSYWESPDGTISVHNYAKVKSPRGTNFTMNGFIMQKDPDNEPGKFNLTINYFSMPMPINRVPYVSSSYWVLDLGPINKQGLYDYAIVSDSSSVSLYVLARNVKRFYEKYEEEVDNLLEELGFVGIKSPIYMYHGKDCEYEYGFY